MRSLTLIIWAFCLISCGSAAVVDYDKAADFSQLDSYDYYPRIDSGLTEFDNRRLIRAIDSVLETKGMSQSIRPEFLINFYTEDYVTESNTTIGVGIGGGSGNVGYGVSGGIPVGGNQVRQLLTLDIIDVRKDALIWQGVIAADLKTNSSPEKKEVYYSETIVKLLADFPPENE